MRRNLRHAEEPRGLLVAKSPKIQLHKSAQRMHNTPTKKAGSLTRFSAQPNMSGE